VIATGLFYGVFFNYFLNLILEYCPKKYAIRMGINEKAIFFSKRPYSENATNIEAEIIIKIKSNSLFFI
jgi:hypothetical protein